MRKKKSLILQPQKKLTSRQGEMSNYLLVIRKEAKIHGWSSSKLRFPFFRGEAKAHAHCIKTVKDAISRAVMDLTRIVKAHSRIRPVTSKNKVENHLLIIVRTGMKARLTRAKDSPIAEVKARTDMNREHIWSDIEHGQNSTWCRRSAQARGSWKTTLPLKPFRAQTQPNIHESQFS